MPYLVNIKGEQISPIIPLSLLSRVEVGLWGGGPRLLPAMSPAEENWAGLRTGLESVPLGLRLEPPCGEGEGRAKGWHTLLLLKVDEGLSEQGEAVLQVNVELGLPPWAEVSPWKWKETPITNRSGGLIYNQWSKLYPLQCLPFILWKEAWVFIRHLWTCTILVFITIIMQFSALVECSNSTIKTTALLVRLFLRQLLATRVQMPLVLLLPS